MSEAEAMGQLVGSILSLLIGLAIVVAIAKYACRDHLTTLIALHKKQLQQTEELVKQMTALVSAVTNRNQKSQHTV